VARHRQNIFSLQRNIHPSAGSHVCEPNWKYGDMFSPKRCRFSPRHSENVPVWGMKQGGNTERALCIMLSGSSGRTSVVRSREILFLFVRHRPQLYWNVCINIETKHMQMFSQVSNVNWNKINLLLSSYTGWSSFHHLIANQKISWLALCHFSKKTFPKEHTVLQISISKIVL